MAEYLRWFDTLGMHDVEIVGGKNASLGEMISHLLPLGVRVPGGFATTAQAYRHAQLADRINAELDALDVEDVAALARAGEKIRGWILEQPFPDGLEQAIVEAYGRLCEGHDAVAVAVRSSATAEDLPDASFAGQQETFLNIRGAEHVLHAVRHVFASLFNDRAISYRVHQGFAHGHVALSAGIQRMVRADTGASGVMFTLDTESGFRDVVFVTASYGLGETVVQPGRVLRAQADAARWPAGCDFAPSRQQIDQDDLYRRGFGRQVDHHGGRPTGGPASVLPDRRRGRGAGTPGADHRGPLRPADGYRVGQGR